MPEWMVPVAGGVILLCLTIIGCLIKVLMDRGFESIQDGFVEVKNMFNSLVARFDKLDERQRECVTWADLDKELGPLKSSRDSHEKRIIRIETTCEGKHGK